MFEAVERVSSGVNEALAASSWRHGCCVQALRERWDVDLHPAGGQEALTPSVAPAGTPTQTGQEDAA